MWHASGVPRARQADLWSQLAGRPGGGPVRAFGCPCSGTRGREIRANFRNPRRDNSPRIPYTAVTPTKQALPMKNSDKIILTIAVIVTVLMFLSIMVGIIE